MSACAHSAYLHLVAVFLTASFVITLCWIPQQNHRIGLHNNWVVDLHWLLLSEGRGESDGATVVWVYQLVEGGGK